MNSLLSDLTYNFAHYRWEDNLLIFPSLEDNIHTANLDLRFHHHLICQYDFLEAVRYIDFIWSRYPGMTSVVMSQILCHRLWERHYPERRVGRRLELTVQRAKRLNLWKWICSGYWFRAVYSNDLGIRQRCFMQLLDPVNMKCVDMDCYRFKIIPALLWLKLLRVEEFTTRRFERFLAGLPPSMSSELLGCLPRNAMEWDACHQAVLELDQIRLVRILGNLRKAW